VKRITKIYTRSGDNKDNKVFKDIKDIKVFKDIKDIKVFKEKATKSINTSTYIGIG
jgi:hypothetical protein